MKKLLSILIAGLFVCAGVTTASAAECQNSSQTNCTITIRDNRGLKVGTEERGSNGKSTLRDSRGIKVGTVEKSFGNSNCEVLRDAQGRKIGTRGKC